MKLCKSLYFISPSRVGRFQYSEQFNNGTWRIKNKVSTSAIELSGVYLNRAVGWSVGVEKIRVTFSAHQVSAERLDRIIAAAQAGAQHKTRRGGFAPAHKRLELCVSALSLSLSLWRSKRASRSERPCVRLPREQKSIGGALANNFRLCSRGGAYFRCSLSASNAWSVDGPRECFHADE